MARLKINGSDLLGKLHLAAIDKVNKEFKSGWGKIKQLLKRRSGRAENQIIENTAFDDNTGAMNIPNGPARIRVVTSGTHAKSLARDMMKTYMKWWAGIEDFNVDNYEDEAGLGTGVSQVKSFKTAIGLAYNLTITYELKTTVKKAKELVSLEDLIKGNVENSDDGNDDENDGNSSSSKSNASSNSEPEVINLNDSIQIQFHPNKSKAWESEHPFESLFNKNTNINMIKEKKSEKLVNELSKKNYVKAEKMLKSLIREKINARVEDILSQSK